EPPGGELPVPDVVQRRKERQLLFELLDERVVRRELCQRCLDPLDPALERPVLLGQALEPLQRLRAEAGPDSLHHPPVLPDLPAQRLLSLALPRRLLALERPFQAGQRPLALYGLKQPVGIPPREVAQQPVPLAAELLQLPVEPLLGLAQLEGGEVSPEDRLDL